MKSIGVRELRQNASRYLREVEAGETVEVTDRGRPVARLVPIRATKNSLTRLSETGRISLARGDLLDLGEPLSPRQGKPLPSQALETARADER